MKPLCSIAVFVLLTLAHASVSQEAPPPVFSGYVTRIISPSDFDVDGRHILVDAHTKIQQPLEIRSVVQYSSIPLSEVNLYLGESLEVYGEFNGKSHTVAAIRIVLTPPKTHAVAGSAMIDANLTTAILAPDRLVRSDGYKILITPKTKVAFNKPLTSASTIDVNEWIEYRGTQRLDGVVVADRISVYKNLISKRLDKLREKWEYDPASISDDTGQDPIDKFFRGVDPKKFPPHLDDAMMARINAVGSKLVPRYQLNFPETEETRIDFRFYLIDAPKWHDAMPLPNGIVLVPYQVVDRMQNDSQLAAVLADKVACLLEKQPVALPTTPTEMGVEAGLIALEIESAPVAAVVGVTELPLGINASKQFRLREEQRNRVSLSLMHDAGYNLEEAPVAWRILSGRKGKDIAEIPLPRQSTYLYQQLGETWPHLGPSTSGSASPSGQ